MASRAYARVERERRFLLDRLPAPLTAGSPHDVCTDLYLQGTRLRLRRLVPSDGSAASYKLGQKHRPDGFGPDERQMTTFYLTADEYDFLAGRLGQDVVPLVKRRYRLTVDGLTYAVDVFEGRHEGLILADLELEDADLLRRTPVPAFAIREVTDDPAYEGGSLARRLVVEARP